MTYSFVASTPGLAPITAEPKATCRLRWDCTARLLWSRPPSTSPARLGWRPRNRQVELAHGETDYRLAAAAYGHTKSCYDREYLFQFSEIDPKIHRAGIGPGHGKDRLRSGSVRMQPEVATEPYVPAYFLINGRSMPDLMDANYALAVSAPALQRQSSHASGRAGAGAGHRPGPAGNIRSTSTATMCASWRATGT